MYENVQKWAGGENLIRYISISEINLQKKEKTKKAYKHIPY